MSTMERHSVCALPTSHCMIYDLEFVINSDFEVRMPFEGDMVFDASDSNFEVAVLESLNFEAMDDDGDGVLLISNLPAGADVIVLLGAAADDSGDSDSDDDSDNDSYGAWSVSIQCESVSPTLSPSSHPTIPTPYPTGEPTVWPTSEFPVRWNYTMTLNGSYELLVSYMFGSGSTNRQNRMGQAIEPLIFLPPNPRQANLSPNTAGTTTTIFKEGCITANCALIHRKNLIYSKKVP